ncbi:MAG: hypothetical protein M3O70_07325, partial [Actinomycetota bacterium]|nr:hypothetical protein [Actinomycetota bacterium]
MRPAEVRFYFDADVLGLAKVLASLRSDVTYPGDRGAVVRKRVRPPCPIETTDVDDEFWIPIVAEKGWAIITRDRSIQRKPAEIQAVRDTGAKMFALTSPEQLSVWDQLEIVMSRWRDIERLA